MYYSYIEIEYIATSFSPTRTDLALKLLNLAHSTRLIGSLMLKIKSAMAMSIRSVACGSHLVSMSVICCILGGSEVADFHLLRSD